MMFCDFQTKTHAKWVLAGEHAVIRGKGALIYPLKNFSLTLKFKPQSCCPILKGSDQGSIFFQLLQTACEMVSQPFDQIKGEFHLHSTIPSGRGMGASAALCVALGHWFLSNKWITEDALYVFAKNLENYFHRTSSGVDIVGVSAEQGIYFENGKVKQIEQTWHPNWYLSYCGSGSATAACVKQVQDFAINNPELAMQLDNTMHQSVLNAKTALESTTSDRLEHLTHIINTAADCFRQWGLINGDLDNHMQFLRSNGALAVKPTGSGAGGYVLSLWENPLAEVNSTFITL